MKHAALHSIAHNLADSLGSGSSLLTGMYDFDLFKELGNAGDGDMRVDFLSGEVIGRCPSPEFLEAARRAPGIIADLCRQQGGQIDEFTVASTRFWADQLDARLM